MTTTYELYTNDNGTPKLVGGKAPAIVDRVEALETSVETLETSVGTLETNVESIQGIINNGVVTSVNGNTGALTPEQTGCLPLSGGTMTGATTYSTGLIVSNDTDTLKEMFVSSDGSGKFGAFLSLHRADCPDAGGAFGLFTRSADGGIGPALFATPDGGLTWNGKTVVCVESWVNGVNWYRKYSDGWIEQGGYHPSTGNWNDYTEGLNTSFNTPFVNTKNNVQITMVGKGDLANPTNVTATKFTLWIGDRLQATGVTDEFYWYACGY